MYSEPPPIEPHFYGIGSASTLTVGPGQQLVATPFPTLGERQPPSQVTLLEPAPNANPEFPTSPHSDPSSFDPNVLWGGQLAQVYHQMGGSGSSRNPSRVSPRRELSHPEVSIQTFANNSSELESLRKQAEVLLTNEHLVLDFLVLPKEDQKKFICKVDDVR